jgi:AraC-like DNA-binding protein
MASSLHTLEQERTITPQRTHIILKQGAIPNIAYFGRLRYTHANPPLVDHVHKDIMEICYLDGGEQDFVVKGKRFHLTGGDLFVTYPDERHSTGTLPMEKSTLYWLGVNVRKPAAGFLGYVEEAAEKLRRELVALKPRHFRGNPRLRDMLEKAITAYFDTDALGTIMFRNHITEFLIAVCRCAEQKRMPIISSLMEDLLRYIRNHLHDKIVVRDLAAQVQLSVARFKQRFKDEVGIAPNEYVLRAKIDAAKTALVTGSASVTAVALDFHFSSSQYFATVFKRYTGTSPMDFVRCSVQPRHAAGRPARTKKQGAA